MAGEVKAAASAAPSGRSWHQPLPRQARLVKTDDVRGEGFNDRLAGRVTAAIGTMWAFYAFGTIMAGWILWQGAISSQPFDPYPFAFLLFLGNIVQLLLMPLIMVGQNVQAAHADARAEADFKVNTKAEAEVEKLLAGLRAIDVRTLEIVERLEAAGAGGAGAPGDPPGAPAPDRGA